MTTAPALAVETLLTNLEDLPAERGPALEVVRLCGDRNSSASDVTRALARDPALAARLIKTANSAYYGRAREVTSLQYAIALCGLAVVRSIAATRLVHSASAAPLPQGFWSAAAAHAAGAALLASRLDVVKEDAFCAAVLHEVGSALLYQADPAGWQRLQAQSREHQHCPVTAEQEHFGIDHSAAGARALRSWGFPESLHGVARDIHDLDAAPTGLLVAVRGGRALAARLQSVSDDPRDLAQERLDAAGVTDVELPALLAPVAAQSLELGALLGG